MYLTKEQRLVVEKRASMILMAEDSYTPQQAFNKALEELGLIK